MNETTFSGLQNVIEDFSSALTSLRSVDDSSSSIKKRSVSSGQLL